MSKSLDQIPFDKIYVGMKAKYFNGTYHNCKVILVKDNVAKNILVEWEKNGALTLCSHNDMYQYTFVE